MSSCCFYRQWLKRCRNALRPLRQGRVQVLACSLGVVLSVAGCGQAAKSAKMSTHIVTRDRFVESIAATGRVVAPTTVAIKCKASGLVARLPVHEGQFVAKGDLLLALDPEDEQRAVERARIQLASVEARVTQARLRLQHQRTLANLAEAKAVAVAEAARVRAGTAMARAGRLERLLAQGMVNQDEVESARSAQCASAAEDAIARLAQREAAAQMSLVEVYAGDLVQSEAEVASVRLALVETERRLGETRVVAPMAGTITRIPIQVGQIISSGITNVGGGTEVMTLADLGRLAVRVDLPENDIGRVAIGQAMVAACPAYPGRSFPGAITAVACEGRGERVVFTVEIGLSETGLPLRPGMSVDVAITSVDDPQAVTVPIEAITFARGRTTVRVAVPGAAAGERVVEVGGTDGKRCRILGGLVPGEVVEVPTNRGQWRDELHIGMK